MMVNYELGWEEIIQVWIVNKFKWMIWLLTELDWILTEFHWISTDFHWIFKLMKSNQLRHKK